MLLEKPIHIAKGTQCNKVLAWRESGKADSLCLFVQFYAWAFIIKKGNEIKEPVHAPSKLDIRWFQECAQWMHRRLIFHYRTPNPEE